jgi:hypothetical protein
LRCPSHGVGRRESEPNATDVRLVSHARHVDLERDRVANVLGGSDRPFWVGDGRDIDDRDAGLAKERQGVAL